MLDASGETIVDDIWGSYVTMQPQVVAVSFHRESYSKGNEMNQMYESGIKAEKDIEKNDSGRVANPGREKERIIFVIRIRSFGFVPRGTTHTPYRFIDLHNLY